MRSGSMNTSTSKGRTFVDMKKTNRKMKGRVAVVGAALSLVATIGCGGSPQQGQTSTSSAAAGELDRTVLPIAEPTRQTYKELDARNAKPPARFEVKAPSRAPNVVIVLIDDVGFGGPSTFGGPIRTPTMDRLAQGGLRFNNFHTTALCSPTRNALKTGRNHHTVNTGSIMESCDGLPRQHGAESEQRGAPGRDAAAQRLQHRRLRQVARNGRLGNQRVGPVRSLAHPSGIRQVLRLHRRRDRPVVPAHLRRLDQGRAAEDGELPLHRGHDQPGDQLGEGAAVDDAGQAVLRLLRAPGRRMRRTTCRRNGRTSTRASSTRAGTQVRAETLERQKKLGVIPANTQLGERPKDIVAWDSLPADQRRLFARQAEVFSGFLEQTDAEIGRFAQAIEDIGEMDNTLFIYIAGDNGTSAEGGFVGMYNEMTYFNGVTEKVEDLIPLIDKWGGPETFPHMSAGWAVAFDTPFTWTKQVASDFGGTRNGMVIHWPQGIKDKGGLRSQFSHVIDIAPTILEAATLPEPKSVNGTVQTPIEGTSLVYAFNDAKAPERHKTQYFEMFGNRAIYSDGWFARTIHRAPWQTTNLPPLTSDVWDLYDVRNDFSLTKNLAGEQAAKLKEMQALFMTEAEKYHVLPIDDRVIERMNPAIAGRPDVLGDRKSLTLYEGMQGMLENTFMNVKNRSSKITAELEIPAVAPAARSCRRAGASAAGRCT